VNERILGRTGLTVKMLGFGGIPIQQVSEEDAIRVVRRCYERGINYFDTARNYTVSEERIGKALEDMRDDVILATKSSRRDKQGVLEELDVSLSNLRTDWLDVYQLHNVSSRDAWEQVKAPHGALAALYEAKDQEIIRHVGITSHDPALLTEMVKEEIFETIMIPFNYLTSLPANTLLPLCRELNVGTVIMKPFGGGAFSNANTALMSPAELRLIEEDRVTLGDEFCRGCNYCQPCPQEIPISMLLRWEVFEKRMGWSSRFDARFREGVAKAITCLDCGECESRCPYHLLIRELITTKTTALKKKHYSNR
jgi:predicted aldo/keto reductase-like oxidoreductase